MGIFREQGNGRMGTMIRHLRFVFGLIMLSVFVAGVGFLLIMNAPQVAAYMEHLRMNNMVTWYIIGMIIGSCVTLTAVNAVNRDSGGIFCVDKWKK